MEDLELECTEAFASRGRVIEDEELSEFSPLLLDGRKSIEEELNEPKRFGVLIPPVHLRFLDVASIGACVTKHKGKYFIGINLGGLAVLNGVFNRLCASPRLFTEIGDISKEVEYEKVVDFEITNYEDYYARVWEDAIPVDHHRYSLAGDLIKFSLYFLVYHELGHALLGHLDFRESISGNSEIAEYMGDSKSNDDYSNEMSQFFEFEADRFAALEALKRINDMAKFNLTANYERQLMLLEYTPMWSFSVYCLFRLFGRCEPDEGKLLDTTHPSPGTRQLNVVAVMQEFYSRKQLFKDKMYLDRQIYLGATLKSFIDVEKAFAEVSMKEFQGNMASAREHVTKHYREMRFTFPRFRRILKPFAIVKAYYN